MSRALLHPPATVHSFTLHGGCGKPHEYDGEHGIDCEPCIEHVRLMSPEERISHPALRGPLVAQGETPSEIDALRRVEEAKRHAASWRLVDTDDDEEPPEVRAEDPDAEEARLEERLAELREAREARAQKAAAAREQPPRAQRRASTKA